MPPGAFSHRRPPEGLPLSPSGHRPPRCPPCCHRTHCCHHGPRVHLGYRGPRCCTACSARTPSPAHTAKLGWWSTPSCRVCGRRPAYSRASPDRRANHVLSGQEDLLLPPDAALLALHRVATPGAPCAFVRPRRPQATKIRFRRVVGTRNRPRFGPGSRSVGDLAADLVDCGDGEGSMWHRIVANRATRAVYVCHLSSHRGYSNGSMRRRGFVRESGSKPPELGNGCRRTVLLVQGHHHIDAIPHVNLARSAMYLRRGRPRDVLEAVAV